MIFRATLVRLFARRTLFMVTASTHIIEATLAAGLHRGDFVDHHVFGHFREHCVAEIAARVSRKSLSFRLTENREVALLMSLVRAIDKVPRLFFAIVGFIFYRRFGFLLRHVSVNPRLG